MVVLVPNDFSIFFPTYRPFPPQLYYTSSLSTAAVYTYPSTDFQPVVFRGRVTGSPLGQTSVPINYPLQFYMF
jgi:hypothetical protein